MVRVRLEGVSKKYGSFLAVDKSSFEVDDKEFFIILGPSGCGKSTTLNIIAGLEEPAEGKIYFDEQVVNDIPPEKRDIAMVFQSFALYPNLSASENIAFPLKIRKRPKEEVKRKVQEAAEKLRIAHLLPKRPYQLSGGERQRVALARAIVREPKLFLLDEPLSNIDAKLRVHMRAELIALQKDLKITTIYVTHDQVEAMTMADRVLIMNQGKTAQMGKPLDVFRKPANLFVAGFIGTPPMNFFPCTMKTSGGKTVLGDTYFSVTLDPARARTVSEKAPNSELVLGVRPQHLSISTSKMDGDSFAAEIFAVEPLGTETIVNIKLGENVYKAVTSANFSATIREKVWVQIDPSGMQIFDKKTELAVA